MFWAGGCASCHAAKGAKGDAKLVMSGGVELKTPFGIFMLPTFRKTRKMVLEAGHWVSLQMQ